ncbi:MAG: ankyrin repeat domain-containing protein [Spirochaetota bacterium]
MTRISLFFLFFTFFSYLHADKNYDLTTAARWGKLEKIQELLQQGADINYTDFYGRTPVIIAASQGHIEVMQYLIHKGADTKRKDKNGNSILDFASHKARQYLISKGIVKIPNSEKRCHSVVMEFYRMNVHSVKSGYSSQAKVFAEVYQKYGSKKYFATCLRIYINRDMDKHYSVGMFLFKKGYGGLQQFRIAEVILKRGLILAERAEDPIQVSFLHMIGQLFWEEQQKKKAEPFLRRAYQLAEEKFPGTIPAMTKEKRQAILQYLNPKKTKTTPKETKVSPKKPSVQ